MPDLYSKSEGYNRFLKDAAAPSTPLCFFIITNVLFAYRSLSIPYKNVFTALSLILFTISLIYTLKHYQKLFNGKKTLSLLFATLFIMSVVFALSINYRVNSIISRDALPDIIPPSEITVTEIIRKRYSSEIYFNTHGQDIGGVNAIGLFSGETPIQKGDRIFIHKKIDKIKHPGVKFHTSALIARGIHYTVYLNDGDITEISKGEKGVISQIKDSLIAAIDSTFSSPLSGLVKALLTGNRSFLENKIILTFRNAGVVHALAASGLHVAIFAFIPMILLFRFIGRSRALSVSLASVLFYLLITDMPVSLLRAVLMFIFFYLQSLFFLKKNPLNYLMLTCSLILIISPWEIFSIGFQLSFTATAGILIFYRQYKNSMSDLPGFIAGPVAVTLSAQIFTVPLILLRMNQFNSSGIISNLIVVPLISAIMSLSIFTIILSFLSPFAASLSAFLTSVLFSILNKFTEFISGLNMNFFIYQTTPLLAAAISLSLIPLINHRIISRLKYYPVILSLIICTLYLKNKSTELQPCNINYGNSRGELLQIDNRDILRLSLDKSEDAGFILPVVKSENRDIKVVEISGSIEIPAAMNIINDYQVEEIRFRKSPQINGQLKSFLFRLQKERISVFFPDL